ncbi:MAG: hypothetical protein AAFO93_08305 [Pseudomonadota bacterium]
MRAALPLLAVLAVAACGGDPLRGVERVSDGTVPLEGTAVAALPAPEAEETPSAVGLFSGIFGRRGADAAETAPDADAVDEGANAELSEAPEADAVVGDADVTEIAALEPALEEARPARRGLFSRLIGGATPAANVVARPETVGVPLEVAPEDAAPEVPEVTEAAAVTPRRGLFGGRRTQQDAAPPVAQGTVLPYGAIATVCGLSGADLGTQTERYPERGRGYVLYDTAPGTLGLRTHYLTGFKDGCARQFTAALAIFGAPGAMEGVRTKAPHQPHVQTETDREYTALRARICRVADTAECPEGRFRTLERNTVFVSVYERFGTNTRWADMLLHDGMVLAKDFKGGS